MTPKHTTGWIIETFDCAICEGRFHEVDAHYAHQDGDKKLFICQRCLYVITKIDMYSEWWSNLDKVKKILGQIKDDREKICSTCNKTIPELFPYIIYTSYKVTNDDKVAWICDDCELVASSTGLEEDWDKHIDKIKKLVKMRKLVGLMD